MSNAALKDILEELADPTPALSADGGPGDEDSLSKLVKTAAFWRNTQMSILHRARRVAADGRFARDDLRLAYNFLFRLAGSINGSADGLARQNATAIGEIGRGIERRGLPKAQLMHFQRRLAFSELRLQMVESAFRSVANAIGEFAEELYVAAHKSSDMTLSGEQYPRSVRLVHSVLPDGWHHYRSPDVIGLSAGGPTLESAKAEALSALEWIATSRGATVPEPIFVDDAADG